MALTPPEQELFDAIARRDFDVAEDLQASGVAINAILAEADAQSDGFAEALTDYLTDTGQIDAASGGKTPLQMAERIGHDEAAELLRALAGGTVPDGIASHLHSAQRLGDDQADAVLRALATKSKLPKP